LYYLHAAAACISSCMLEAECLHLAYPLLPPGGVAV